MDDTLVILSKVDGIVIIDQVSVLYHFLPRDGLH